MRKWLILAGLAVVTLSVVASAEVPNIFSAGQNASALQVNQNFQNLDLRVNAAMGGLLTTVVLSSSTINSSVVSATCPASSIVLSANCGCSDASGTRNYGVLFGCDVAGNGGVVGCFDEAGTFNPNLPPARGDLSVMCLSGFQTDGTPLFVIHAAKAKQDADELERKHGQIRQTLLDHAAALKGRR